MKSTTKDTKKEVPAWRKEYKELWYKAKVLTNPVFYNDCADPYDYMKWPVEKKANGLTQLIVNFLTWKGHHANRINTQGQARVQKIPRFNLHTQTTQYTDKVTYTSSMTKRGTPDIASIVNGKAVMIEVKVGKDKLSEHQLKQQAEIELAGGYYFVARNMTSFYEWYYLKFAA